MNSKYEVIAIAHKDIADEVKNKFFRYSICEFDEIEDIQAIKNIQGRTMDLNTRASIYVSWFEDKIEKKIEEGYTVAILELPFSYKSQVELLEKLDIKLGDDLLILEKVDV